MKKMKKTKTAISGALLIALLAAAPASAQTTLPAGKPVKTGNEWHMPADAHTRAQEFTDKLKRKIRLDSATAKKVYDACMANTKSVDEISMLPLDADEKKARLKANKQAFDLVLKSLLSKDQFKAYQAL